MDREINPYPLLPEISASAAETGPSVSSQEPESSLWIQRMRNLEENKNYESEVR